MAVMTHDGRYFLAFVTFGYMKVRISSSNFPAFLLSTQFIYDTRQSKFSVRVACFHIDSLQAKLATNYHSALAF